MLVLAIALLGAIWQFGYSHTVFVPSPADTWDEVAELLRTGETYGEIAASLARLLVGMAIGTVFGAMLSDGFREDTHAESGTMRYGNVAFGVD